MFCEKCGKKLPEQALFCDECGYKIVIPNQTQPKPQQKVQLKPQPMPQQSQAVKQKLSLFTRVIIVEVIALVVLAGFFYTKMKEYVSPEMVAKSYFTSVMSGNTKQAYSMVEVDETEFINETFFEKVIDQIGCKNLYNYKVEAAKNKEDDYTKEIRITYRVKEDTQDYSFVVKLDKAAEKKFLVFDQWKVNVGDYIQKDVNLDVIAESKVTLEGIELGEKYRSDSVDETGNEQYVIPKMFYGTYGAAVRNDIYEDVEMSLDINGEYSNFYEGEEGVVSLKPEVIENVTSQAQADFKALWEGAVHQSDLAKISGIQLSENAASDLSQAYEELKNRFYSEDGTGLKKVDFSNFTLTARDYTESSDYGYPSVNVEFTAPFTCIRTNKDWWTGKLEDGNGSGDYCGNLYYTYQNGKWLLSTMQISNIYYY